MLFSEKFLNKEEKSELIEVLKMRIESVEIYGDKREEKGIEKGKWWGGWLWRILS